MISGSVGFWRASSSTAALALCLAVAMPACSGEEKEPDCVPAEGVEPVVVERRIERFGLGKAGAADLVDHDWCRACVMSTKGFASCQKVYSDEPGRLADRDPLKAKARDKACADAGYRKGECPDGAIISASCKDDPAPEGIKTAGQAVQDLFQSLNPPGGAAESQPRPAQQPEPPSAPPGPVIE